MFKQMQGLSLIELMISLLLGSIVAVAATQMFLVNRQAENLQIGIASVQDSGRFAVDYLSRDLMHAGHAEFEPTAPFALTGVGGNEIADGIPYDVLAANVSGVPDCVGTANMDGVKKLHVVSDASGKRIVCTVYELDASTGNWVTNDKGPLIDNVEAFQVLYGVDFSSASSPAGDFVPDLYTTATQLKALSAAGTWLRVVSVRFSILVASDVPATSDTAIVPQSVTVLDQTFTQGTNSAQNQINFSDGRLYRVYTSTVALRNVADES